MLPGGEGGVIPTTNDPPMRIDIQHRLGFDARQQGSGNRTDNCPNFY
jgi:hypothetical protein